MPEMTEVVSSNIAAIGWEDDKLFVTFKSKLTVPTNYSYEGVPKELFEEMLIAPSVGKFFNEKIKVEYVGKREE